MFFLFFFAERIGPGKNHIIHYTLFLYNLEKTTPKSSESMREAYVNATIGELRIPKAIVKYNRKRKTNYVKYSHKATQIRLIIILSPSCHEKRILKIG